MQCQDKQYSKGDQSMHKKNMSVDNSKIRSRPCLFSKYTEKFLMETMDLGKD